MPNNWTEIGNYLLAGKKIEQIELNKKLYKLNPTQTEFICDLKSDYCLNNGGFGCVDGKTKIYNADAKEEILIEVLYNQKKSISVLSYNNGKVVKAKSTIPVKYEKADLYKIKTDNREIVATKKHRFLTNNGFKKLSDLVVGEQLLGYSPCPQETISVSFQSILLSGVFHLMKKGLDFLSYYRFLFHLGGARPLLDLDNALVSFPLRADVHEHIRHEKRKGDYYSLLKYNQTYQQCDRLSKKDFFPLGLNQSLALSEEDYKYKKVSEYISCLLQSFQRFLWKIIPQKFVNIVLNILPYKKYLANDRPLPNPTILKETIQEIKFEKNDYYYDLHIFGTNNYLAEGIFHHNSGKSLALYIKLYLFLKCFPGNVILLGRKTLADITRAILPDLFDIIPLGEYDYRVKDAVINFKNGSQIILFGLDAMQSGGEEDIKKAQQKIKSLNLGGYFIDQLEEVDYEVFDALNSRLRLATVPVRQGNMTCNPANFWAYHFFVRHCIKMGDTWIEKENKSKLYNSSMLDNKDNLPEDYIRRQIEGHDQKWIDRYVYGIWTPESLTEKTVFSGYQLRWIAKRPIKIEDGISYWEEPKHGRYKIGVDPSEGVIDPASISVVSGDGKLVATFCAKVPIVGLAEKIKTLYYKFNKPQIVVEVNDKAGGALLENIKDLNIYRRQVFDFKDKRTSEKLGFKTNHSTKRMLISNFQDLMKKGFPKIYDQKTIEEFNTFVWSDEARQQGAGAQRGFHDDRVMSALLAFWEMSEERTEQFEVQKAMPKITKKTFQYY